MNSLMSDFKIARCARLSFAAGMPVGSSGDTFFASPVITSRGPVRVPGDVGEGGLGDLLSELRLADLSRRSGMNEVEMTADELGEGVIIAVAVVAGEQLEVGVAHLQKHIAAGQGNPTEKPYSSRRGEAHSQ